MLLNSVIVMAMWVVAVVGSSVEVSTSQIFPGKVSGNTYNGVAWLNNSARFVFPVHPVVTPVMAVRVTTASTNATKQFPLVFVVQHENNVLTWRLPILLDYTLSYNSVSRTICPERNTNHTMYDVSVVVTSMSNTPTYFTVAVNVVSNFAIGLSDPRELITHPSQPIYYAFEFPPNVSTAVIKLTSNSSLCAEVSIQDEHCPVFDLDTDITYEGQHQTFTKQATVTVKVENYKSRTVYIVILVKPRNADCTKIDFITDRLKVVNLVIVKALPLSKYLIACLVATSIFLGIYAISIVILCICRLRGKSNSYSPGLSVFLQDEIHIITPTGSPAYGTIQPGASPQNDPSRSKELSRVGTDEHTDDSSDDSEDEAVQAAIRSKTAAEQAMPCCQQAVPVPQHPTSGLSVSDLSRNRYTTHTRRYVGFSWNLVTIGVFYGLPVIQLCITYQRLQNVSGDEDICYFNFRCANHFGVFSAFNAVFSNIGYVMLGLLFMIIVYRRDRMYSRTALSCLQLMQHYGIPQYFGLFYAMGVSLVMEGFMSACYHVCPSYSNFQFDTTFMYITACLLMLKVYESRHPDMVPTPHKSYVFMALLIFAALIGVVSGVYGYWITFVTTYVIIIFLMSCKIYYVAHINIDTGTFRRVLAFFRNDFCRKPAFMDRFVLLVFLNVINIAMAIYGGVKQPSDFATYILAILVMNLFAYTIFYIIMKFIHQEKPSWIAWVFIGLSVVLWSAALYFFTLHVNEWALSPALSREHNRDCVLLEFFDYHDVWHFLSATSMFTSFLLLLHLDDDTLATKRSEIVVF